jgi:hypothetical protein
MSIFQWRLLENINVQISLGISTFLAVLTPQSLAQLGKQGAKTTETDYFLS